MTEERNPALLRVTLNTATRGYLESVLAQYCFLPATIVEFLKIGAVRLKKWKVVKTELERNIAEEMGTITRGSSHFEILRGALQNELLLDVSSAKATVETCEFLNSIRVGLNSENPSFVAGILYGLEASAIPELTIVAKLINAYSVSIAVNTPIDFESNPFTSSNKQDRRLVNDKYTLNRFFAAHLLDFEVGHKQRLAATFTTQLVSFRRIAYFEQGFEYLLQEMAIWWKALSISAA
jgi:hypothetical protein